MTKRKCSILTLAFIILTMTMIFHSTKIIQNYVYALSPENETSNMNTRGNILDTNKENVNVNKIDMLGNDNIAPNQYIIKLKENVTSNSHLVNNITSSLSDEGRDFGINIINILPNLGIIIINLNQTIEGREARIVPDISVTDVLDKIQKNPNVEYIQPVIIQKIK